jgi:toxin ParE1/3/4
VLPVVWTPKAQRDYREIIDYLDQYISTAADRFANGLATKCRLLETSPRMGRTRDELYPGLRSLVISKYLIFYRVTSTAVEILRILYGARNLPEIDWNPDES